MKVILDRFAVQELFDATIYFAAQSQITAEKFIDDFEHAVNLIQSHPEAFPEKNQRIETVSISEIQLFVDL
jgi:plasmid stabilization system protein ParE